MIPGDQPNQGIDGYRGRKLREKEGLKMRVEMFVKILDLLAAAKV